MAMDIKAHYINLDRRSDRNHRFLEANGELLDKMGVSLTRYPAIDGKALIGQLDKDQLSVLTQLGLAENPQSHDVMSWGHLACALSHRRIWDVVSKDKPENLHIVMEDDIELSPDFADALGGLLDSSLYDNNWDLLYGGWNADDAIGIVIPGYKNRALLRTHETCWEFGDVNEKTIPRSVFKVNRLSGTGLYLLKRRGARMLASAIFPMKQRSIDLCISSANLAGILNSGVSIPPLAKILNDHDDSDLVDDVILRDIGGNNQ